MDIIEAIDNRKTIRKFDSYRPTTEEIKRIINSARLAPSAINAQNWKFIAVVDDNVKKQLAESVLSAYDKILSALDKETMEQISKYKSHSVFFQQAPLVIVCVLEDIPAFMGGVLEKAGFTADEIKLMRPDSYLLSMGGAIENMFLSAYSMGIEGCWMVAPVLGQEGMRKVLKLGENQKIVSLLALGKVDKNMEVKRANKKELSEIMEII
ncbi:MAG: nitroreductase family protein [Candidatus Gastranaerophilales bacterium]|nr:nitroreductase family protein [Candidatus Gastranaerophilales bacterium]